MHLSHHPHRAADWGFDGLVVALTITAACVLPAILREGILLFYGLPLLYHAASEPATSLRFLFERHGGDTDIFLGSIVWVVQSILLLGYGAGAVLRRLAARQAVQAS